MNRILVIFCLLAFSLGTFSQEEKPIEFDAVIQQEGKQVKELYPIIKAWVATSFINSQKVIQMDDPVNGVIICKGVINYRAPGGFTYRYIDGYIDFTLKIQIRDGRYKVTLNNFNHKSSDSRFGNVWSFGMITNREKFKETGLQDKRYIKTWPDLKETCKVFSEKTIADIKAVTSEDNPILDKKEAW